MKKGFTLTEVLVAVAILILLTAIILPNFSQMRQKSRDVKRITDLKALQVALDRYFTKYGKFPATGGKVAVSGNPEDCFSGGTDRRNFSGTSLQDLVDEGFISSLPKDPVNKKRGSVHYCYNYYPYYSCQNEGHSLATYALYFYPENIETFGGPGGGEHSTKRYRSSNDVLCLDP